MLDIEPWSIFWTVVNIIVLYLGLRKFLFGPIMKVIQKREDLVKGQFDSATNTQDEADRMKAEYREKLAQARQTAEEMVTAAKDRSEQEREKMLEDTRAEQQQMLEKTKADIQVEQEKAQKEAQSEIARLAISAARKIIKSGEENDAGSN